jgi:hypothetical protein
VAAREEDVRELLPLLARRVDARGVVRARVQEEDAPRRRGLERGDDPVEREPDGRGVEVRVRLRVDADVPEDRKVVD